MKKIVQYYSEKKYDEIGIASFGPVCLNRSSEAYGSITSTPKLKWTNFPLLNEIKSSFHWTREIGFDTDVNSCALAEYKLGKHGVR